MKQYKYGYYRLKKENEKLKEQLQELQKQFDKLWNVSTAGGFYRKED